MQHHSSRIIVVLGLFIAGCAGFKGGWESVPYLGDTPPQLQSTETPFESRERKKLRLDALTLGVDIDNQLRTHDVQVYGFAFPLSVDPRTVPTQPSQPGKTRVNLEVSGLGADFVFRPSLAKLSVGEKVVAGTAGFEFGTWNLAGQRVSSDGQWQSRPIGEALALDDRTRSYLLMIEFRIETPPPVSRAISLDLSQALTAPGIAPLPSIRFAPGKWKHGYT